MKKFKKLIPALCMLLVSAVMLGSTTFAWFSMNNTVTATGMEVAAKSDELFLAIKYGSTYDKTHSETTATSTATKKELLPVDHGTVTVWQFSLFLCKFQCIPYIAKCNPHLQFHDIICSCYDLLTFDFF